MATKKPTKKATPKPKKPAETKKSVGRPSLFKPEYVEQAYKFALLGATDEKMAELFGVNPDTIHEWKKVHPEFSESIMRGKHIADSEIAESLYNRAKGYSHPEDDIRTLALGGSDGSKLVITPTTKHYPPDTAAASLWLRNRQPALWRDKTDIEHAGAGGGPIKTESTLKITADEAYKRMLAKK